MPDLEFVQKSAALGRVLVAGKNELVQVPQTPPAITGLHMVSSAGTSISIPDNQANGAISTITLATTTGTPTGAGTYVLGNGGFTHVSLSATTGTTITLNVTGIVAGDIGVHNITIDYSEASVTSLQLAIAITVFDHLAFTSLGTAQIINPTGSAIVQPWISEAGLVFKKGAVPAGNTLVLKDSSNNPVTVGWRRVTWPDGSLYHVRPVFKATETIAANSSVTYTYGYQSGSFNDTATLVIGDIPDGVIVQGVIAGSVALDNGTWTASTTRAKGGSIYNTTTGYGGTAGSSPTRGRQLITSSPVHQEWHMWMCMENGSNQAHKWTRCDFFVLQVSDKTCFIDMIYSHPYFNGPMNSTAAPAGSAALNGSGQVRHYGYHPVSDPTSDFTITVKDSAGTTWVTQNHLCLGYRRGYIVADTKAFPMVVNASGVLQTHHRALWYVPFKSMVDTTIPPFWCGDNARAQYLSALSAFTTAAPYTLGTIGNELHADSGGSIASNGDPEKFLNDVTGAICLTLADREQYRDCLRTRGCLGGYNYDFHIDPTTGCMMNYTAPGNAYTHAATNVADHSGERAASSWVFSDQTWQQPWDMPDGGDTHQIAPFFYPYICEGRFVFLFMQGVLSNANNTLLFRADYLMGGVHYFMPRGLLDGALGARVGLWPFFDAWHTVHLTPSAMHWYGQAEWTTRQTCTLLATAVSTTVTSIDGNTTPASLPHRLITKNLTNVAGALFGTCEFVSGNTGWSPFNNMYGVDVMVRVVNAGGIGATDAATFLNGYLKNWHLGQMASTNHLYVADPGVMVFYNADQYTPRFTSWDNYITSQSIALGSERNYAAGGTRLCNLAGQGTEAAGVDGHSQHHLFGLTELLFAGVITRSQWNARVAFYGVTGGSAGLTRLRSDLILAGGPSATAAASAYCRFAVMPSDIND